MATTESDLVNQLASEACLLYGGSPSATIQPADLPLVFSTFPEGCFSESLAKSVYAAAKIPVGSGLDSAQLLRVCRALEQTTSVSSVSLLEGICCAAYHRVFVAVDHEGNGYLDEVGQRLVLEAFGCPTSAIAAVRSRGVRELIYADEINKLVRIAVDGNFAKQASTTQALKHIFTERGISGAGSVRGGGGGLNSRARAATMAPTANAQSQPHDPTAADLVTMLDLRSNGGANMKDVADACYAALPILQAEQIAPVLSRTIELANGTLLDEVALNTFIQHHLAQYVPGLSPRAIIRALADATCMKLLAVAGCLASAGLGALTSPPPGSSSGGDTRNRPLSLTPYLEALGFSRTQITSSYQNTVSVNEAVRRIFKAHSSKQAGAMKTFLSHRSKVAARAGPRNNPPPPGSEEELKLFEESFRLLDSRGLDMLNFDNVMEFLEPIPSAPDPSIVQKLFELVDGNHNDNLDRAEFRILCLELEKAKIMSFGGLLQCFREFAHRKMFEIADKDGGGTIDKQELRMVLECVGCTTTEIAKATKDMPNELSLDEFSVIISPFSRGKSLSQIVEQGNRMQKTFANTKSAMKMFQDGARRTTTGMKKLGDVPMPALDAASLVKTLAETAAAAHHANASASGGDGQKKMCFTCAELDATISTLQAQIESLKLDLSNSEYAQDSARSASEISSHSDKDRTGSANSEVIDDLLRGDLYRGMRAFENVPAALYYKKYPQLSKSFIYKVSSDRVSKVIQSIGSGMKEGLAAAHMFTETHKKKVDDLMEQLTVDVEMIVSDLKSFWTIASDIVDRVSNPTNIDKEKVQYRLVDLNAARQKIQSMSSDMEWISEKVIEWSTQAVDLAVVAAPFTSRISDVLNNAMYVDTATIALVEALVLCNFISSGQPTDAEVWARRVLSGTHACVPEEAVPALKQHIEQASQRLGTMGFWEKLRNEYRRSFSLLHKALSRSSAAKKDKAVFTQGNASYAFSIRALNNREGGAGGSLHGAAIAAAAKDGAGYSPEHPAFTAQGEDGITILSPRLRNRKPEITDPVKYVDKILNDLKQKDPAMPIPDNFRRIDPAVNTFWFNDRIIDLFPNDNNCVVKVGGGYVMFQEYVQKYGHGNTGDAFSVAGHLGVAFGAPRPAFGQGAPLTPRGGAGSPSTPRAGGGAGNLTSRSTMRGGSPPTALTPRGQATPRRVLVRNGKGVVLH